MRSHGETIEVSCNDMLEDSESGMPIRPELRALYPYNWKAISARVRFERAQGRCESCGKPHGERVRYLTDGRWCDSEQGTWRDRAGGLAPWPRLDELISGRSMRVILAAAHVDHDPRHNAYENLAAWCQLCHLRHDRKRHLEQRRITYRMRWAIGDFWEGTYVRGRHAMSRPSEERKVPG